MRWSGSTASSRRYKVQKGLDGGYRDAEDVCGDDVASPHWIGDAGRQPNTQTHTNAYEANKGLKTRSFACVKRGRVGHPSAAGLRPL